MMYQNKLVKFTKKGYPYISLNNKRPYIHVLEWEKHNGKKPAGHEIHHIDSNLNNWNIDNLILLTNKNHRRLHNGWKMVGNTFTEKLCGMCNRTLPLVSFGQPHKDVFRSRCLECEKMLSSKWYFKNIDKMKERNSRYYYENIEYFKKYFKNKKRHTRRSI